MKITPKIPQENYNVSAESDMKRFIRYGGFLLFLVLGIYLFFILLSYIIVANISLETEKEWFDEWVFWAQYNERDLPQDLQERYKDVEHSISLIDMDIENAFASIGWKVYLTEELLKNLESYEALDFIIGHELGHVENRDVLRSIISDAPIALMLSIFGGDYGSLLFRGVFSNNYSKIQETRADRYGLDFVYDRSGHVGCALDFFEKQNTLGDNLLGIFSTHPMTEFRISRAHNYAASKWYPRQECTSYNYSRDD